MIIEEWRDIPHYEGLYQASNLGNVRSLDRYITNTQKNNSKIVEITRLFKGKILKPKFHNSGYFQLDLYDINGKKKNKLIHRLVATSWIMEEIPEWLQVCHNDGNKLNNKLCNLRIDTAKNNQKDRELHGTKIEGEKSHFHKLSDEECIDIIKDSRSNKKISEIYDISKVHVLNLKSGKSRKYLKRKFNID